MDSGGFEASAFSTTCKISQTTQALPEPRKIAAFEGNLQRKAIFQSQAKLQNLRRSLESPGHLSKLVASAQIRQSKKLETTGVTQDDLAKLETTLQEKAKRKKLHVDNPCYVFQERESVGVGI
jgi:hypothetical protein